MEDVDEFVSERTKKNFVNACIIRQTRARTLTNDFEGKKKEMMNKISSDMG